MSSLSNRRQLDIELIWLRAGAGCWLVFLVLGIFTDLSLGRFDCVDFIHTHHLTLVIELPDLNRGWLVSILVGLSITAVDTYVVQYGVWVYATHAFRQSADSSGISS